MKNLSFVIISIIVSIAVIATIPFCISEKRTQRKFEISRGAKKVNYV